jgi:hypothetical protein
MDASPLKTKSMDDQRFALLWSASRLRGDDGTKVREIEK